ncbi:hypothetical protein [Sphingobacterium sp. IITKGP-BTPF85]|uniref:hypothetical protein n=1 Tax=Sphingobacterium sp. IITKGP-BTPF85 TaxID=1338009 RepID=UPI0029345E77|nr:hypothetical protein [Sphingobacterium sp. IITKGP-BTPF85]
MITLTHPSKSINGTVQLTGSKSESNRALIIQALGKEKVQIENLSQAFDTVTLKKALLLATNTQSELTKIDIGPQGPQCVF